MILTTIKITPAARLCLRRVAALTEEKHYEVLDRLLAAEEVKLSASKPITREQYHQLSGMMTEQGLYPVIDPAK